MAATLSSLSARVRDLLADGAADLWGDPAVTEALRLALGEYTLAAQVHAPGAPAVTLSGLDGAPSTSLPEAHETLIVLGAAGYAAQMRAVDRAGLHDEGAESRLLADWGSRRLGEYKTMLAALFPVHHGDDAARLAELRASTNPTWGLWVEDDRCQPE